MTPMIKANENPRNTSPPNMNKTITTSNTVPDVINVRLSVLLIAVLNIRSRSWVVPMLMYSLILSKMITVSLIE